MKNFLPPSEHDAKNDTADREEKKQRKPRSRLSFSHQGRMLPLKWVHAWTTPGSTGIASNILIFFLVSQEISCCSKDKKN